MRILVIFTGGTIGSRLDGGWIGTDDTMKYKLLSAFSGRSDVEFSVLSPYTVLSENLSNRELISLQKTVCDNISSCCDGIIITHGTDTLQYSAAVLEYAVAGCDIPILFVSAAYPLDDPMTNGYANFEAALEFIRARAGRGVFVSYKNENDDAVGIHIATHVLAHAECSADIYSITGKPYASYLDGKIKVHGAVSHTGVKPLGTVKYNERSGILVLSSQPGDAFSYSLDGVGAVILKPYHSATLNTENRDLVRFCALARERGIPIFAANVNSGAQYSSSKAFSELGIETPPYSTFASLYVKLWAGLSLGENVLDFVRRQLSNEIVTERRKTPH